MAEVKTKKTPASVPKFLAGIEDEAMRADCKLLVKIMRTVTGSVPRMWGSSMVGFGDHHYVYESGHEGDCFVVGFAPRKRNLVLYLTSGVDVHAPLLARLGKHEAGKGCLYLRTLADVDLTVLQRVIAAAVAALKKKKR